MPLGACTSTVIADPLAEDNRAERRRRRDGADAAESGDLDVDPRAGLVDDDHVRSLGDDVRRALLDDLCVVEPVAEDHDPPLEQALLVLRRVVLEVLRQVAVGASGADRLDDLSALRAFELGELGGEASVLLPCQLVSHQTAANPRALRLAAVCRRCADSSTLRRRTFCGVTSTHSSSRISSSAWSSESARAGISRTKLVGRGRAHVRELLLLRRVDVEVVGAGVLADDHPLVDVGARPDDERAAFLEVDEGEGGRLPRAVGDEAAGRSRPELAVPRLEPLEDVVEDAGPARLGEELGAEPDQAAGGDDDVHPHPARAVVDERLRPSLAKGEQLRDDAEVLLGHVDRDALHRLVHLAVDDAGHDLRLADRQLESLASHLLDQHRELQLAATLHLPHLGPLGREDAQRDVSDELGLEPALDLARGQLVAVSAGERSRVDADGHRERRLVDGDHGQRPRIERVGEGLADHHLGDAGDGDQVARPRLLGLDAVERLADEQLGHLRARDRPVGAAPRNLLARGESSPAARDRARAGRRTARRRGW